MKGSSGASRWGRCLRAPIRMISGVRDLYIKGMNGCAGRVQYTGYGPNYSEFGHSYSFSSARSSSAGGDEDMRELIRAASVSRNREMLSAAAEAQVRRSQSVVIGRIDEEEPTEFKEDVNVGADLLFPRSRSVAVGGVGVKPRHLRVFA